MAKSLKEIMEGNEHRDVESCVDVGRAGELKPLTRIFVFDKDCILTGRVYDEGEWIRLSDEHVLGECGMTEGIDRRYGGATHIEVWLFDKKDIVTHSYVLVPAKMSEEDAEIAAMERPWARIMEAVGGLVLPPMVAEALAARVTVLEARSEPVVPESAKRRFTRLVVEVTIEPSPRAAQ